MATDDVMKWTVAIDEPRVEMIHCVATACGREVPKHEAWRVKVEEWRPIAPDTSHRVEWRTGSPWQYSARTWSAAGQAMLTAAAPSIVGPVYYPAATHAIYTYTGYGCCEAHASEGAIQLKVE